MSWHCFWLGNPHWKPKSKESRMWFRWVGLPGWRAENISERTSWRQFNCLEYSIASHYLLKQAQCLKIFIEWLKSFPLALLAKLGYRNTPCIFIFHYNICLAIYWNTVFLPWALSATWKNICFETCFTISHSHFFLNVYIVCIISVSINLTSILFRHLFYSNLHLVRILRWPQEPTSLPPQCTWSVWSPSS